MAKKKIENRIQDYRAAHHGDQALDDLLGACEAELYKLRRENELLQRRAQAPAPAPAQADLPTS